MRRLRRARLARLPSALALACGALLACAACSGSGGAPVKAPASAQGEAPAPAPQGEAPIAPTQGSPGPAAPSTDFLSKRPATSLLSGRLAVRLPEGARIEARARSVMAAAEPDEEETRVVLDAGDERFVLMAHELFALGGKDPEGGVRAAMAADFPGGSATAEPLRLADEQLKAWAVFPGSANRGSVAIPVLGMYVLHPDGFVQRLAFYVNPPAAKDAAGCSALAAGAADLPEARGELPRCTAFARAIAATLSAGARRIDAGGGERSIKGQGSEDSFLVKVPAGASTTVQRGPDFTVHRVRLPVELGASQSAIGIYVGGHPSFQYNQNEAKVSPTPRPGKVFGKAMSWQVWPMSPTRVMAEAMLPHPKIKGLMVHLFAGAADDKALAPLLDVAASLRVP
ncbi:hypothetical protein WME79_48105 [Sorangium sp. So ce726]|uniref:hypothetical protein n=1 Tax=Sorangium sp. So ce726 TaxID=3133319 RepID=UPI003F62572D